MDWIKNLIHIYIYIYKIWIQDLIHLISKYKFGYIYFIST